MYDQQSLSSACAYAQSDQSLCLSLEYSMIVKLLTEHYVEFLSFKGGCRSSSESTLVKMSNCWKSHVAAHSVIVSDCGSLPEPENGNVQYSSSTTYGSRASYTCDPQYAVVGVKELVCTENGIWSGTFLGCRINGNYDVLYFFKHMLLFFLFFCFAF